VASIVGMETVMTPQRPNRKAVATSRFDPFAILEGTRSLDIGGPAGARPKRVLEFLLAAGGDRVPIADLLWGERISQNEAAAPRAFIYWAVPTRRSKQLPPHVAEQTVAEAVREVPIP
jgi:hypothetical protein